MSHDDPHSQAADAVHEGRPVEEQYTKQGKGGRRISIEMGIAIALTVFGFAAVFLFFSGSFNRPGNDDDDNQVSQAQAFDAGTPATVESAPSN